MTAKHPLLSLFVRFLLISATTVGGGFVILSVLRRRYVEQLGILTEEEMLDLASVAQTAPGAVAVNASLLVGYRLAGLGGALVSLAGILIPPVAVMSALAAGYRFLGAFPLAAKLMTGMQAGVAAVILDTALSLTRSVLSDDTLPRLLLFAVSLALILTGTVPAVWLVLGGILIGALRVLVRFLGHRKKEAAR